jgi:phosphatidylethanolamine-binding protein (PEBP) family uncharacterized protein
VVATAYRDPFTALILDDPYAPAGRFIHWLAWGITPDTGELGEGDAAHAHPAGTALTDTASGSTP